jgi:sortase A
MSGAKRECAGSSERLRKVERWLLVAGVVLLTVFAAALLHRSLASRTALIEFDKARSSVADGAGDGSRPLGGGGEVDFRLWSEKRVRAYRESLTTHKGAALAVLSIARLGIRVPVFEGTDELALNRGVGWIAGTARPGEAGNICIAGHRDGFFRVLKDASPGDVIELSTVRDTRTYTVDQIEIVSPYDVSVLQPRGVPSLTLVTCYPFYFLGDAPQRFILHAALKE